MEINTSKETSSNQQITLVQACKNKDIATAKKLLEHGANVNEIEVETNECNFYYQYTPLIEACKNNDLEMVKLLVRYGADVNKSLWFDKDYDDGNYVEYCPIIICFKNGNFELIKFLLDHWPNNEKITLFFCPYDITLSGYALHYGYKEIYNFLIERRERLSYKDGNYAHHFEMFAKDIYPRMPEHAKSFTSHSNLFGNLTIDLLYSFIEKHKYIKEIENETDIDWINFGLDYIKFNDKDCYVKYDFEKTYQYYTEYMIEKSKDRSKILKEGIIAKFWSPENVKVWAEYYHVDYDEVLDIME